MSTKLGIRGWGCGEDGLRRAGMDWITAAVLRVGGDRTEICGGTVWGQRLQAWRRASGESMRLQAAARRRVTVSTSGE